MCPPSTHITYPVTYEAAGRQRNTTTNEMSLGCPGRQIGVREINRVKDSFMEKSFCRNICKNNKDFNLAKDAEQLVTESVNVHSTN